jgi:signal transduction histidine kinase
VFYRIAQESLTNVLKHADASRVDVVLETRDGVVMMVVSDDGVGFDTGDSDLATSGFGLMGMQERASLVGATLVVESAPGQGTTVYLRAPRQEAA